MKKVYNLTGKTTEEAAKIIDEAIKQCRNEAIIITEPSEITISPEYQKVLDSGEPEAEIAETFLYSSHTFDQYQEFKKENGAYFDFFNEAHEFLTPGFIAHQEMNGTSQLDFFLKPKNTCCYGFQVYCENEELELVQVLKYLDFMDIDSEEDWKKYKKEEYWDLYKSVGKTKDINLIADYVCHIGKQELDTFTGVIPLSLKTYMLIKDAESMDYDIVHVSGENQELTPEEESAKQSALEKIAIYLQ